MDYTETRRHELRKRRLLMVDGNLTLNSQTTEAGASARAYRNGYWGFASTNDASPSSLDRLTTQAAQNAAAMARFGAKDTRPLPGGAYRGEHVFRGRPALSQKDCVDRMAALHAWCKQRYPDLVSTRFLMHDEHHSKWVANSNGSEVLNSIQRAACGVTLTAIGDSGTPVELYEPLSAKGSLADLDLSRRGAGRLARRAALAPAGQAPCRRRARRPAHHGAGAGACRHPGARGDGPPLRSGHRARRRRDRRPGRPARGQRADHHGGRGPHLRRPGNHDPGLRRRRGHARARRRADQGRRAHRLHEQPRDRAAPGPRAHGQRPRLRAERRAAGAHAQHGHPAGARASWTT